LFASVADELERAAAADAPLGFIVEDIHWADASSLALLRFMVSTYPICRSS
jgi:predicted ATPase